MNLYRARYGAGSEQITGSQVASGDGVMNQLLLHRPVHIFEVRTANHLRCGHFGRLQVNLQLYVVSKTTC